MLSTLPNSLTFFILGLPVTWLLVRFARARQRSMQREDLAFQVLSATPLDSATRVFVTKFCGNKLLLAVHRSGVEVLAQEFNSQGSTYEYQEFPPEEWDSNLYH